MRPSHLFKDTHLGNMADMVAKGRNWSELKRVGMHRGAYHFAQPALNAAHAEADYFYAAVVAAGGLETGDLLALDLEPTSVVPGLAAWALAWLRRVEQLAGVKPIIYTGKWVIDMQGLAGVTDLADYGLWLAAYQARMPAAPAPWSLVSIWQHTSSGSVDGIDGDVDLNVFNGAADRLALYGKPGAGAPPTPYAKPGQVGPGVLAMMAEDGTEPALPSTFWPLGAGPAIAEECVGLNGTRYIFHLPTGRRWRYPAA